MPSSSAHWVTGRTTSAAAAVSDEEEVADHQQVERCAAARDTASASGAQTTAGWSRARERTRTPSGCPERLEQLDGGQPGPGQIVRVDAPDPGHVGAGGGVGDLAVAGQLVGLLAVLAAALAVALAGERAVAAARRARAGPSSEREVDRGGGGVGAVDVLLDAAAGEDVAPPSRGRASASRRAVVADRSRRARR